MNDNDGSGYWALMFWHFHGLGEGSGRYIGELLAARYGQMASAPPARIDDLLAQLEATEAEAPSPPPPEAMATPAAALDAP